MANRYWVGNTGNWNDTAHWATTSGGSGGASVPTSADNAYFDVNSFNIDSQTVSLDVTANCLDMVWTGVTNTPSFNGNNRTINVYGNLTFVSAMSITSSTTIALKATATGNTITTAGLDLNAIGMIFNGAGGGWTLQDNVLMATGSISLQAGTLNCNNKNITVSGFSLDTTGTRTLTMTGSIITVNGNWNCSNATNLTLNAGTSKIIMTGDTKTFTGGGLTYYVVELQGTPTTVVGSNTFEELRLTPLKTYSITAGTTQTIKRLGAIGTAGNVITLQSTSAGSAFTINAGNSYHNVNYVSFKDCAYALNGVNAYNSTNVSGNTGITFLGGNPVFGRYWVNNSGNWSDTSHWSTISNGAGDATVPASSDNVYFDGSSFSLSSRTVTLDTTANCLNMSWSGVTNTPTFAGSSSLNVYGHLTFVSGMTVSITGSIYVRGSAVNLDFANKSLTCDIMIFSTAGVSATLQSNVTTTKDFYMGATFNTGNYNISCRAFDSNYILARTITLGSSTITASGDIYFNANGLTLSAGTSTVTMTGNTKSFYGGSKTWYNISFQGTPITVSGNNTFNQITLNASKILLLTSGSTQTVANWASTSTKTTRATLMSTAGGSRAAISKSSGTVELSHMEVQDINATGGATYIFRSSRDWGNNLNINFYDRYWIGRTGNTNDTAEWATYSGGAGGASVPTSNDDVYFDANSFNGAGQTVTINATLNCRNMDWTGVTNSPTLADPSLYSIHVYGNVTLATGMSITGTLYLNMKATATGKTITTAGRTFYGLVFDGVGGEWTLQDDIAGVDLLRVDNGSLITNGKSISCTGLSSSNSNIRSINLGTSVITVSGNVTLTTSTNLTFTCGTSKIIMTGATKTFNGGGLTWYDVELQGTPITIAGSNIFNKLICTANKTLKLTNGLTQTIGSLTGYGTLDNLATIESTSAGSAATIYCPNNINIKYYSLKDITVTGGAVYNAIKSTNVSGNSGWTFADSATIAHLAPATTEIAGFVELATATETLSGNDSSRAVTPNGLKQTLDNRITSGSVLPTPSVALRGQVFLLLGGAGVADVPYLCRKNASDAYEWYTL